MEWLLHREADMKGAFQAAAPLLLEKIIQLLTARDLKVIAKLECSQLAVPTAVQLGWLEHVRVCRLHSSY